MSDSDDRKPAAKKKAPPSPPHGSVVGRPTGDGTPGNPVDVTTPERRSVATLFRRVKSRWGPPLTPATPVAGTVVAVPPAAAIPPVPPPVLAAPPAAAGPPLAAAEEVGNFLTLFNDHGFFPGGVTTGFADRREAFTVLQDRTLITDKAYKALVNAEYQLVKTNNVTDAPPTSLSSDIPGRIFPDPKVLPRSSPFHVLREYAAKFYLTPVPWDGRLLMGDLLVYVFVMLNFLRDGIEARLKFKPGDGLDPNVDFGRTYGTMVASLGPLLSSAMVSGPAQVNVCDKNYKKSSFYPFRVRNPELIFLVLPIFKMVKAFFPGKTQKWTGSFGRTGRQVVKWQSEKLVKHGVYSNAFLNQIYVPGGTGIPDEGLLHGMLFEFAVLLAFVNPVFCSDARILIRVRAKGRNERIHYCILPGELDLYRDAVGVVTYHPGDDTIFIYKARVLQHNR
jgi:hypothetical protein